MQEKINTDDIVWQSSHFSLSLSATGKLGPASSTAKLRGTHSVAVCEMAVR